MESLLDGLNVAPEKGMLPSIPETSEAGEDELLDMASSHEQQKQHEDKDFNKTIGKLESEIENLREARSTLEHETKRLRGELQELSSRLRSSESMLRNQVCIKLLTVLHTLLFFFLSDTESCFAFLTGQFRKRA